MFHIAVYPLWAVPAVLQFNDLSLEFRNGLLVHLQLLLKKPLDLSNGGCCRRDLTGLL